MKIPIFMSPVFTGGTHSCLGFINDEADAFVFGELSQLFVEVWSGHLVSKGADWLDNDGTNLIGSKQLFYTFEASFLLGSIFVLMGIERVLELWILSLWPWESWKFIRVGVSRAN